MSIADQKQTDGEERESGGGRNCLPSHGEMSIRY
jgi:hypothetical protein